VPRIGMGIERHGREDTTQGLPSRFAAFTAVSSAGLSSARCERCIQYTTQVPSGSAAPARRTVTRGSAASNSRLVMFPRSITNRLKGSRLVGSLVCWVSGCQDTGV
jgi:hypothetical protein